MIDEPTKIAFHSGIDHDIVINAARNRKKQSQLTLFLQDILPPHLQKIA